jgi:hypothetical protein
MFRVAPPCSLALDQSFGRLPEGLDLRAPAFSDRILAIALDLAAGLERSLARVGEPYLRIGAKPHVATPAADLVPEHPGARATVAHNQHKTPDRAVAIAPRPSGAHSSVSEHAFAPHLVPHRGADYSKRRRITRDVCGCKQLSYQTIFGCRRTAMDAHGL